MNAALALAALQNYLVDGVGGDDMMDEYRPVMAALMLARGSDAFDHLLKRFHVPPVAEHRNDGAAFL